MPTLIKTSLVFQDILSQLLQKLRVQIFNEILESDEYGI